MIISQRLLNEVRKALLEIPTKWDGHKVYLDWQNASSSYLRQTEWIGFRFQELCEQLLRPTQMFQFPGPKYKFANFDALAEIPWDFKAHIRQNPRGQETRKVPGTDKWATNQAINNYGASGFLLGVGTAVFNDAVRSFQLWHDKLKGGLSKYEKERLSRGAPSRLRKTKFILEEIWIIEIDEKLVMKMPSFQEGFRNADGSPRKAKVMLDLNMIVPLEKLVFIH